MQTTPTTQREFSNAQDAFAYARSHAKYGRREWLVWQDGCAFKTAWLSLESVEAAIEATALSMAAKFFHVTTVGHVINVGPALAQIMLKNKRNGM